MENKMYMNYCPCCGTICIDSGNCFFCNTKLKSTDLTVIDYCCQSDEKEFEWKNELFETKIKTNPLYNAQKMQTRIITEQNENNIPIANDDGKYFLGIILCIVGSILPFVLIIKDVNILLSFIIGGAIAFLGIKTFLNTNAYVTMGKQGEIDKNRKMNEHQQNIPKCPICNSTNIHKISSGNKVGSALAFGIFSIGHISKTYKCGNCGSKF